MERFIINMTFALLFVVVESENILHPQGVFLRNSIFLVNSFISKSCNLTFSSIDVGVLDGLPELNTL